MARDPVLQWAADAAAAEQQTGVPASVLLGLVKIESGGIEGRTSPVGAGGLTQFMPATARTYGVDVRPGHASSQLLGAGRYLTALGFAKDPAHALAAYNGGPGNANLAETRAYAQHVLAAAKQYTGFDGGHNPITQPAPDDAGSSSSGLLSGGQASGLRRVGLTAVLVLAAVILAAVGLGRLLGVSPSSAVGAATAAKAA